MGAKCPITVVPNGVDLNSFQPASSSQNPRSDLGIFLRSDLNKNGENNSVIITTSRLVKKNGIDILIESLRFLPGNFHLQILGTGPEEKSLKQFMSRFDLDSRVQFLGHVPPDQVAGYLSKADVFARPSRSEGLGNSFLEAMAAGVPVVGTPVGGIPDFLKNGETGWFCEVDNPKDLADKIQYILDPNNRSHVEQVIINAKKLVAEKYNWQIISQQMAQIIANLAVDK